MALEIQLKKEDPKTILLLWDGDLWREVSKSLFFNDLSKFSSTLLKEDFLERFSLLETKVGKRYSLYLLSQRGMLSTELEEKLTSKGISIHAAKEIVQYCSEKGFLNDREEIARLVRKELRKGGSTQGIFFKLKSKKRLDEVLLRAALQEAASSDEDALHKWLAKNARKVNRDDPHEMRKLMSKLCRRGFPLELVFKCLSYSN